MPDPNLPSHVSVNLAAILSGHSARHVRYLIRAGMLTAELTAGGHRRIAISELERLPMIGPITAAEFLQAERRFDDTRGTYNRRYNASRLNTGRSRRDS